MPDVAGAETFLTRRHSPAAWLTTPRFALLLLLFVVALFPQVILGGKTFFYGDFGVFGYPLAFHLRESFWHGEIPLWNPLNNGGVPFLAQWNTMALYPPSLFFILLPLSWSLGVFCIAHLYLGGLGMYLLAHRWTGNRLAAAIAGMTYSFNGFAWSALVWPQVSAALGWAPWVLLQVECASMEGGRRIMTAAAVGALQMLTGGVEVILFTWLMAGALMLLSGTQFHPWKFQWRSMVRFSAVVILIAGLCAAQLLPFLDLAAHSQRGGGYMNERWPMEPAGWANLLLPLYRTFPSFHDVYAQKGQQWTASYYMGITTVALAVLALTARDRRAWLLWILGAVTWYLALGEGSPLYTWLRQIFPPLAMMRYPVKFVLPTIMAMPLLAALGFAQISDPARGRFSSRVLFGIGCVLALIIATLAWHGTRHPLPEGKEVPLVANAITRVLMLVLFLAAAALAVRARTMRHEIAFALAALVGLWIDNRTHVPRLNPTVTRSIYEPGVIRDYLKFQEPPVHGAWRIMPSYESLIELQHRTVSKAEDEAMGRRVALSGNLNLLDGFSKANGFFALYPRETWDFHWLLYSEAQRDLAPLKDFFGARYITAPKTLMDWTRRDSALPMVTSGQRPIFANDAETLRGLADPRFNPVRTVFLPTNAAQHVGANPGTAKIIGLSFATHHAAFDVESDAPSLVVIAQSFYHCWRATIDGSAVPILRANHAFQAVLVPGGKHQIVVAYRDNLFWIGCGISAASLFGTILAWLVLRRQSRPRV